MHAERHNNQQSREAALKVLREDAGTAFDPDLVERFAEVLPTIHNAIFTTTQSDAVENAFEKARARPAGRPRILVVDDEASIRDLLAKTLALAEWDVDLAPDGRAAVEALRLNPYDLLMVDLKLPGMDGMSVIREANRLKSRLPVVIITGFSTEASAIQAVNLGVAVYLTKPFRVPQVLAAAAKALGRNIPPDLQRKIDETEGTSAQSITSNGQLPSP